MDWVVEIGRPHRLAIVTADAALKSAKATSPGERPLASSVIVPETAE